MNNEHGPTAALAKIPAERVKPPDTEPDGLFGECEGLDADSMFRKMMPESIKFFDLPLMERLHQRNYHMVRLRGSFRLAKLVRDYRAQLLRSESCQNPRGRTSIDRLMFSLGGDVYVVYDMPELLVYAPTTEAAAEAVGLLKEYRRPEARKPSFKLISVTGSQPSAQPVKLDRASLLSEQELALHYGDGFDGWERAWLERLRQRSSGLSIFHGPPGCGKTSYVRHLMARLLDTFEFYFMPVSTFDSLDSPRFVRFWLEEAEGGKRRIAVVEDAESLLLPRNEGSQSSVSSLLNATDGLLGDHLRLQIIATTNAPVRELDPALTRPGRLVGVREFGRLAPAQARRLAEAKGIVLPDQQDFSLAEIYCGRASSPMLNADRHIGFAP
jgi:hypothetical protein